MLVVKSLMWFVKIERYVEGVVMLFEGLLMLTVNTGIQVEGMLKTMIKIVMPVDLGNAWMNKTVKKNSERWSTVAILQTLCSMIMYLFVRNARVSEV